MSQAGKQAGAEQPMSGVAPASGAPGCAGHGLRSGQRGKDLENLAQLERRESA
ncbi:MAG: hypothetical protein HQL76_05130 [Magnetococcales bacterium]|nr:hypothetical protein [Magnetococcales bacterium]